MITVDFKESELASYRDDTLAILMMRMKMRGAGIPLLPWKPTDDFPFNVSSGVITLVKCVSCHGLHVTYLTVEEFNEKLGDTFFGDDPADL